MPSRREGMRRIVWTTAAFGVGVLLHVDRIPVWVAVVVAVCATWRLAAQARVLRIPGRITRVGITIALIAAVVLQFRTLNGLSAGTALLAVMGSVKLLETSARRDRFIVIGASLFLLLAACLDRQALLRAPLYLLHAWICCAAFAVAAHDSGALTDRKAFLLAGRSLLLALPLALLLFVLFPRLPSAFWALPPTDVGATGLSESMSPGSIEKLTASYDPAFRARFIGQIPPPQERYWRGLVLHDFDGFTWQRSRNRFYRQHALKPMGPIYRYTISLEPTSSRWWIALDIPTRSPVRSVFYTYDYQLIASQPVTRLTAYEAESYTRTQSIGELSMPARRYDTRLPENRNPRSRELALSLRARTPNDEQFVQSVLAHFRTGGFEYTLEPPRLGLDSVDDFIFRTRAGFCGHYASAFVSMMRAGGVPARVVTGYQGGEWNPIGEFFTVRQSDAHAWAEVWLDKRGWTRVDPTAAVEPERLTRGIMDLLPDAVSAPARLRNSTPWLADLLQGWDALNNWWGERIVKFDFEVQSDILNKLGIDAPEMKHLGWSLAIGLIGWLLWVSWHIGISTLTAPRDHLARAYLRLCNKLARAGVERAPHQGPLAYAETLAQRRPDLEPTVRPLLARYAELRYGPVRNVYRAEVSSFARSVSRLRVA